MLEITHLLVQHHRTRCGYTEKKARRVSRDLSEVSCGRCLRLSNLDYTPRRRTKEQIRFIDGKLTSMKLSAPQRKKLAELSDILMLSKNAVLHYAIDAYYDKVKEDEKRRRTTETSGRLSQTDPTLQEIPVSPRHNHLPESTSQVS